MHAHALVRMCRRGLHVGACIYIDTDTRSLSIMNSHHELMLVSPVPVYCFFVLNVRMGPFSLFFKKFFYFSKFLGLPGAARGILDPPSQDWQPGPCIAGKSLQFTFLTFPLPHLCVSSFPVRILASRNIRT